MQTSSPHLLAEPRRWGLKHTLIAVVCLGLVAMWVYAFFFATKKNANALTDTEWTSRAEALCAPYKAKIDALPQPRDMKTPQERAVLTTEVNAELDKMVGDLKALPEPSNEKDRVLVGDWLAGWSDFLIDRDKQVEEWAAGRDPRFNVTANANGGPVNVPLTYFAQINKMRSCADPGDMG
jgi:hypothetical protein